MDFKKVMVQCLPQKWAKTLRYQYRFFRQKFHKPLSEEAFRTLLVKTFGIRKGDTLFIHCSIDFLNIHFSPLKLLHILIDTVGANGTLLFPGWHFDYRAEDYLMDENNIFDIKRSPAVMGLLPELARRLPDAQRSIHPSNSIIAVGKNAKVIIEGHERSIYPCGENSPYYKMLPFQAKIIGIGANVNFLAFVHCPEDMMKGNFPIQTLTTQIFTGNVKLPSGEIIAVRTLAPHRRIQKRNIPAFVKKHLSSDTLAEYEIRGSDFFVADANALYSKMIELAKQNVTIYTV